MNNVKISVVTVCYNAVKELERTILSVLNQTYDNVEYIVIDGGSTDGTVEIIKKYADRLAYWVSEPDKGIYDAMNKGIKVATGDWINFMNAGDYFCNENVMCDVYSLLDDEYDIIYGSVKKILKDINYIYKPFPIEEMSFHMILPHQATFIKTGYHKKHLFDISFKSSGDYNFFYTSLYDYSAKFKEINVLVANYEDYSGMSKDNWKLAKLEDLKIRKENNSIKSLIKVYVWFLYRDLKNLIKYVVSEKVRLSLRNYQIKRQGYVININKYE